MVQDDGREYGEDRDADCARSLCCIESVVNAACASSSKPGGSSCATEVAPARVTPANVGILQYWFEMGLIETPTELALITTRIVNQGVINSLTFPCSRRPTTLCPERGGRDAVRWWDVSG